MLTFIFDSGFSTVVSLPLAFILAKTTDLSAPLIYLCVFSADIIKVVWGLILLKNGGWINNIVNNDNQLSTEKNA